MRERLFGRRPMPGEAPGEEKAFPVNWSQLRFACWFVGIAWLGFNGLLMFPRAARWLGWRISPSANRALLLGLTTAAALGLVVMVVMRYRRAVNVVFTSEGIWTPDKSGGRFIPWTQVVDTQLVSHGRGATDIELSHPDGSYRIWAVGFENPYAVSRFVKARVGEAAGRTLPTEGEL
jgi:hypothetical protein